MSPPAVVSVALRAEPRDGRHVDPCRRRGSRAACVACTSCIRWLPNRPAGREIAVASDPSGRRFRASPEDPVPVELVEALATVRKGLEVDVVSACEAAEGVHLVVDVDVDLSPRSELRPRAPTREGAARGSLTPPSSSRGSRGSSNTSPMSALARTARSGGAPSTRTPTTRTGCVKEIRAGSPPATVGCRSESCNPTRDRMRTTTLTPSASLELVPEPCASSPSSPPTTRSASSAPASSTSLGRASRRT